MDALLIKVPEAAALLGVSRAKLYELTGSGALPAVKVNGCRRIRTEDLREFVTSLETTANGSHQLSTRRPASSSGVTR